MREPTTFALLKFRTMRHNDDAGLHREFVQALIRGDEQTMPAVQERAQTGSW